jgi:hypothetical protein
MSKEHSKLEVVAALAPEFAQKVTTEIAVKDWRHGDTKESHKVARSLR